MEICLTSFQVKSEQKNKHRLEREERMHILKGREKENKKDELVRVYTSEGDDI